MQVQLDPSHIQYMGIPGISRPSLAAVEKIVTDNDPPARVTLVSKLEEPTTLGQVGEHLFLFWEWNHVPITIVHSGFASGYPGTGPTAFSLALCMILSKVLSIDCKEVSAETFQDIENKRITTGTIEAVRYVDNLSYGSGINRDWILPSHYEHLSRGTFWSFYRGEAESIVSEARRTDTGLQSQPPTAFISYSWDSDAHEAWVRNFAERLRKDGINAKLDKWETSIGDQLPEFMERSVRDNDFVIVICTPRYRERSDKREGGVGYEGTIMTAEIMNRQNHRKFLPILRSGTWVDAAPSWLAGKQYADLSDEPYSELRYMELIETLRNEREAAPPIGHRTQGAPNTLREFCDTGYERWSEVTSNESDTSACRYPFGSYEMGFALLQASPAEDLIQLRDRLRAAQRVKLSGWTPFLEMNNIETWKPYIYEGAIEARVSGSIDDPSVCDFWRVSTKGELYTIRGYVEDSLWSQEKGHNPGTVLDRDLPAYKVAEGLLFASRFAAEFEGVQEIATWCRFSGLCGRSLVLLSSPIFGFKMGEHTSLDPEVVSSGQFSLEQIENRLTEVIHRLVKPLHERFSFYDISLEEIQGVIDQLHSVKKRWGLI